jgi:glycyl-tRNA synthetase beta chain
MTDSSGGAHASGDLLIELGCEELPPKSLDNLRESLFSAFTDGLRSNNFAFDAETSRAFSTPRRLALLIGDVAGAQPDQVQDRRGPSVQAAYDEEGNPTPAALGFARSVGLDVSELGRQETDKGAWLHARVEHPGQPLDALLYPILEQAIRQLPVPKPMRWGDNEFSFVRPVHWLIVLHGDRVIDGTLLGKEAGRHTRGHRIHAPGPHEIGSGAQYESTLEGACVIADPDRRRQRIRAMLEETDSAVLIDDSLLAEVNNLVEWPSAVACTFEDEFLAVPHAALVASMQDHQKFFPVRDANDPDRVSNRFVAISNVDSQNVDAVRDGYERVIRPRLADARFFLEQDQSRPLEGYLAGLDGIVFQKKIGTVGDKSRRMASVSKKIAELLGCDRELAARSAMLAKCDLMTQMVGEFPELQGVMGHHYALISGEPEEVAVAIGEHYAPAFAGDSIPNSTVGCIVGIADRADTLVGIFAAGLRPTGNKDPFALRRGALGMVRILLEGGLQLPLNRVLALAANALSGQLPTDPALLVEIRGFIVERLRHYYREQDYSAELVSAALASDWDTLPDLDRRLVALSGFMGQDAAASLAAANKRIGNILRKAGEEITDAIDADRLVLDAEKALFGDLCAIEETIAPLLEAGDYSSSLTHLAELRAPVDAFFDSVMVMDEDPLLRGNRLALLARLKAQFDRIADLSVLG